jgi:TonB family protein
MDSLRSAAVVYPQALRAAGRGGVVVAEFVVGEGGGVEMENFGVVSSPDPLFTEAVREALRTAVYHPAIRKGEAVRQLVRQPFEFVAPVR